MKKSEFLDYDSKKSGNGQILQLHGEIQTKIGVNSEEIENADHKMKMKGSQKSKTDKLDSRVNKFIFKRSSIKVKSPKNEKEKSLKKLCEQKVVKVRKMSTPRKKISADKILKLSTPKQQSPLVKLDKNRSKVKALINVFEENVKLCDTGQKNEKSVKIEPKNLTNGQKIKNAFEILIDANGETQSKTPEGKVKRCRQKDKIISKDNNRTLDNWLKKL